VTLFAKHRPARRATRFAEATGGNVVALAAILGHANLRTVRRYVHLSREHRRTRMQRFVEAEEIRANPSQMAAPKWRKPAQTGFCQ